MTAMESKAYGREEEEDLAWRISSLTFLVEDCLGSWGDKEEDAMEAGGEEMIWYTRWSKCCCLMDASVDGAYVMQYVYLQIVLLQGFSWRLVQW